MAKTADTIAIYSRKSRYTGKGESIGNQIDLCREYIRTHYGDAAAQQAVAFEDEGFSGGNLNRPDFKKMMTAAKERKIRAIVVYRLDRISRNKRGAADRSAVVLLRQRMYPKVTGRKTAEGRVVFPYMCKLKERSHLELCSVSNANGNLLDAAICEQVKHLADHSSDFMKQLEKARSAHAGNRSECETKLSALRKEQAETQRKITALIDSLTDFGDSTAAVHLKKRIEELNGQDAALSSRIRELESLTDEGVLAGMEFDLMRQLLTVFHDNIDDMTVTQKRAAIRTVARKVVWDGKVAHVVLFGSPEDEIDWTTFPVDPEEDENAPESGGDGSDSPPAFVRVRIAFSMQRLA